MPGTNPLTCAQGNIVDLFIHSLTREFKFSHRETQKAQAWFKSPQQKTGCPDIFHKTGHTLLEIIHRLLGKNEAWSDNRGTHRTQCGCRLYYVAEYIVKLDVVVREDA